MIKNNLKRRSHASLNESGHLMYFLQYFEDDVRLIFQTRRGQSTLTRMSFGARVSAIESKFVSVSFDDKIGRITASGETSEYNHPPPGSFPLVFGVGEQSDRQDYIMWRDNGVSNPYNRVGASLFLYLARTVQYGLLRSLIKQVS